MVPPEFITFQLKMSYAIKAFENFQACADQRLENVHSKIKFK
jgi:hypothetical protein